MSQVIKQRMTAQTDDDFVVFLIGMRINKIHKVHRWAPVVCAMGQMVTELMRQPSSDLLHLESWFGRTTIMVQYWRSFDALERYAKNPNQAHLPAWAKFNQRVNSTGDVGIWHETYTVAPSAFETMYNHMPEFGLAKATKIAPVTAKLKHARSRLNQ
ncbi:MAG: DUF4188 domain-containing protein [Pseudomonadales bacterium]|nr:DUF4188 domain-containing protein [Pseudomonadales bacterium]